MDFIDLKTQQARIQEKIKSNIQKVLNHGSYILGPEVKDLEEKLAKYVGVKHAIACASGTDALLMALMAYDIKPGDAIFTTPFTFIATAEVIALLGATPIFVDIDPKTYNIDPAKLDLAIKALKNNDSSIYPLPNIEHRTLNFELTPKGIIPVDLFGLLADYEAIQAIADEHHLFVIEDAAQSFGAQYENKMSCSYGNIACTSFFPAKPLGCYGDGGMCFTNDNALADKMNSIKVHGKGIDKYENIRIGINGRLDTLQAAILLAKFDIFPEELVMRQTVARRYTSLLTSDNSLLTPCIPPGNVSAWAQYSLLTGNENHRTVLLQKLQDNQIPSAIYYPKSLHMQTAFAYLGYQPGDFPVSENCSTRIFSIPMHPYLNEKQQAFIADIISAGGQPMT
ncbi:MAG: DegT/DnrJ/EryC1/StrS aminotransferase family protein [Smithella sp.]|nr:DegT/DnrJ/EryC1/StrS aminotransferase family protein [Smithella sp.]HOU51634.1 DegT/DnrJ/EryC1/StrS aminotransferase family protein [Smithella sp.]